MTYQHPAIVRRILESLVPVVCPPDAMELGIGADIVDHVGEMMGVIPPMFRNGLVAGLVAYDSAALLRYGRRAHQLPPAKALAWFERWEHGVTPIERELAKAIGQLLKLGCYEQPAMQERLGYRPAAWIEEVKRRRLTVYGDDVRRADAAVIAPDPLRPPIRRQKVQ